MLNPSFDEFLRHAADATLVPVARTFLFDADTAVTAFAKLYEPPFGFLLESVEGGEKWARYTFVGTRPREAWRLSSDGRIALWSARYGWRDAESRSGGMGAIAGIGADPLDDLARRVRSSVVASVPGLPPFTGGAVGYLGYDVVRYIERLPNPPGDDLGLPDAVMMFTDSILAIDNIFGRAHAIALVPVREDKNSGTLLSEDELRKRYEAAVTTVDAMVARLADAPPLAPLAADLASTAAPGAPQPGGATRSNMSRAEYEAAVERVREYIAAGDAFQVVISQRLTTPLRAPPYAVYRALRSLNPSPYLFYLELDGVALIGSSPEALVRLERDVVTVRPIAGTRRRGADAAEDEALGAELLADPKERAEHLMLVDLGRNDVGRVARFGSIRVPQFQTIERYSHVLHLVSQVEGDLRDDLDAIDVIRACFPAGTVSGAPKVRAMEIIDELEPTRRGPYAGAVGYVAYGARALDTAIAIRTIVAADGAAHVQAGAGIVADSEPAREYEETLAKAAGMLRVLESFGGGKA